jgi:beta propeller repeat protein
MKKEKIVVIFVIVLMMVFVIGVPLTSSVLPDNEINNLPIEQEYVKGEVLVKFRKGVNPEKVLQEANLGNRNFIMRNFGSGIKFERVHSIKPAVAKARKEVQDRRGALFGVASVQEIKSLSDEQVFELVKERMRPEEETLYRTYKIKLPENVNVEQAIGELGDIPGVEFVEPNHIYRVFTPNDPYFHSSGSWNQSYDDLWGIKKIQADSVWDVSQGEGVVVAVIDTGVMYIHEDLADNMWINEDEIPGNGIDDDNNSYIDDVYGWDFAYDDNDPNDRYGHGTHCAGTIAGIGNNSKGVIGVAPKAKIMAVKFLSDTGMGTDVGGVNAVKYAVDNGAHITSNSWGGSRMAETLRDIFNYAFSKNVLSIAAAGNTGGEGVLDPASLDNVMAVSASDLNDIKTYFSTYGKEIDVSAPGGGKAFEPGIESSQYNILSTMPDNSSLAHGRPSLKVSDNYWRLAGTSMATPHVSGVAALILSSNFSLTNDEVRKRIQFYADDVGEFGKDKKFGYGRVNAYWSLRNPFVNISYPFNGDYVRGIVEVLGSVYMENSFQKYELYFSPANNKEDITIIKSSDFTVLNGILGTLNTSQYNDGDYYIFLRIFDVNNLSTTYSVKVNIDNYNEPPEFIGLGNKLTYTNKTLEFKVRAEDPDDPKTQGELSYSAYNLPLGANFDSQTQIFSWTPSQSQIGNHKVGFVVSDNEFSAMKNITITVFFMEKLASIPTYSGVFGWPMFVLYEDKVVIQDYKNSSMFDIGIRTYDLSTGEENQLGKYIYYPDIYEDKVVWVSDMLDGAEIYMYDLSNNNLTKITNNPFYQNNPSIYKNKIAWDSGTGSGGQSNIYLCDLEGNTGNVLVWCNTSKEEGGGLIHIDSGNVFRPDIYEDKVVYEHWDSFSRVIKMYDLLTHNKTVITQPDSSVGVYPFFYNNKVLYGRNGIIKDAEPVDWYRGLYDVYMYDVPQNKEIQITNHIEAQREGYIYENKIVWTDHRNENYTIYFHPFAGWIKNWSDGNLDIYMHDLLKDSKVQITSEITGEMYPAIYKNKIAYLTIDQNNTAEPYLEVFELF